ncbi:hybrid sensor histidine kinase/response regulator [Halopseudomonas pelagia]|uniref:hybrid sensor histidine kinase/response regulator n=1 Tax=Halopseudomonas pelagia TaxID=553151 RepID=UPI00039B5101|nr:hybrid sensor histidine kinase/response regulator [Halopseudomonas pelagia]|tara:strand:- start:100189 stop:101976 length:1788 start_codon:yes stop_codon:yes gene_type:complete
MTPGPAINPPIDEPALLAQQRSFTHLRFSRALEAGFQLYLHGKMCSRVAVVAFSCISFMLLFVWVDLTFLPDYLNRYTIAVRLAVLAVVCVTLWYANRAGQVPPRRAFAAAILSYVLSGLMVTMIIVVSRIANIGVTVTHDGLYLVLLSGFFLLGLPMRHAVLGSWTIVVCYLGAEYLIGSPRSLLISSGLFLVCFNLIGSLGAYIYEYMMRGAYLNERLLVAARARAERESQSKTRFLATASHDLRQPLHAMSLFIQHLDERVTDPQARLTVKRLSDSTQLLQAMLNSLLDISRLSVGMVRPQLSTFNLHPWLLRVLAGLEASAEQRGIRIQLVCPHHSAVHSDPLLLERLIRNFLNNAVLHAQATDVRVEVTRVEQRVRLSVVDNGCGMSAQEQERIFEEFTQLNNPARTLEKGVGLGLSICRQLMHLLEYPSGLLSAPGQGSRFWIEVPSADWTEDAPSAREHPHARLCGRVVIIENDLINQEAMETVLREWGCEVRCYQTPEQALDNIESGRIDLLISDYRLEGSLDGIALIQALRGRGLYSGPALLVTADTSEELVEATRLTDIELLYKPVLPARLRRLIQQFLAEPSTR